jgi:serine/threonine protein phosphatase 1
MIKSLFSDKKGRKRPVPAVPTGQRVYAIGDIHGRQDLLEQLLAKIDADNVQRGSAETHIVFLGDLVDRGPDSKGVIDTLLGLSKSRDNIRFLLGNHEEVMIGAHKGDPSMVRFFCRIGGRETILSYGVPLARYRDMEIDQLAELLPTLFPAEHIDFLSAFEDQVIIGDYLFVHAGIRPKVPLAEQRLRDLRWIREDFISYDRPHEKFVIHGHTISEDIDSQSNRIGIDTGAYLTDRLTAIGLEGSERWFVQTQPSN